MSDPIARLAGPAPAPATRRPHAPVSADLLDMEDCSRELGISKRSLERLLSDPTWEGPRPFRHSPKSKKNLFLTRDVRRYRDAVSLLALRGAKPSSSEDDADGPAR